MSSTGGFRLPTRVALGAVLAGLALPALAGAAQADNRSLSVTGHVGYHDVTKQGEWMPVNLDITNRGGDFQGSVEVSADTSSLNGTVVKGQTGSVDAAVYQIPLSLPAGATKHLRVYMVADYPGMPVAVRVVENGHAVFAQALPSATNTGTLIGVLSDEPTVFDDFAALPFPSSLAPKIVHLTKDELPDSQVMLRAFDLIAVNDFATDGFTSGQRAALTDYVANGGSLLLGTGAAWHKTLAGVGADLLPMQVTGTSMIASPAAAGGATLEVATGSLSGGRAWLASGSQPLLTEKTVGNGIVTLATFDWAQEPMASWSGLKDLLRQVAVRAYFGSPSVGTPLGIGGGGPVPYSIGGGSTSLSQRGSMMSQPLNNLPALDLPSFMVTGLLILAYVLLVGPANYIVLRLLGRRELSWITIPAIAVVFAVGAYGIAIGTKGQSVQSNQIAIVHVVPGASRAYQESYTGVFAPTRGDYAIRIAGTGVLIAPLSGAYANGQGSIRVSPGANAVDILGMTAFNLRGFASEGTTATPGLTASLQFVQGNLVGMLENHSTMTFSDAVLVAGDAYQTLGPIGPGASIALRLQPKAASPFNGNPVSTRIYPSAMYGNGGNPGAVFGGRASDTERRAEDRTQILQLLLGGINGAVAPAITPMLIAWSDQPLQTIAVNGNTPRAHATSAVVVPLTVSSLGSGAVPAGLIPARLIDFSGEGQPGPGSIFLQNGTATYEFSAPLAAGTHLTGAALSSSNAYMGKPIGPTGTTGGQTLREEVWDWAGSAWRTIDLQDNGTTTLPSGAVNPATGTVRVRLTANIPNTTGPGFLLGNLSLTGTLQ